MQWIVLMRLKESALGVGAGFHDQWIIGRRLLGLRMRSTKVMEVDIVVKQSCPKLVDQNVTIMLSKRMLCATLKERGRRTNERGRCDSPHSPHH